MMCLVIHLAEGLPHLRSILRGHLVDESYGKPVACNPEAARVFVAQVRARAGCVCVCTFRLSYGTRGCLLFTRQLAKSIMRGGSVIGDPKGRIQGSRIREFLPAFGLLDVDTLTESTRNREQAEGSRGYTPCGRGRRKIKVTHHLLSAAGL